MDSDETPSYPASQSDTIYFANRFPSLEREFLHLDAAYMYKVIRMPINGWNIDGTGAVQHDTVYTIMRMPIMGCNIDGTGAVQYETAVYKSMRMPKKG